MRENVPFPPSTHTCTHTPNLPDIRPDSQHDEEGPHAQVAEVGKRVHSKEPEDARH